VEGDRWCTCGGGGGIVFPFAKHSASSDHVTATGIDRLVVRGTRNTNLHQLSSDYIDVAMGSMTDFKEQRQAGGINLRSKCKAHLKGTSLKSKL